MTQPVFVYITARDKAEALAIGRALVEERLAACINVFNNTTSLYWWQGTVQEETEVGLIAKSTQEMVERLIARVKEMHSYSCPCVVSWPVGGGNPEYLQWIGHEVGPRAEAARAG